MLRDRYVSRDAGPGTGRLRTRLLMLDAGQMTLNAKVDGELKVRLVDSGKEALLGFDWSDCQTIRGDSLVHLVDCRGTLDSLRGRPIHLEFTLREAALYGFDLR